MNQNKTGVLLHSLFNRFSGTLIAIQFISLWTAKVMLNNGIGWGIFPLVWGLLMFLGYKHPRESPREVFIITFLGRKTDVVVESLTVTLEWIPMIKIVGLVKIGMEVRNLDIDLKRLIQSKDGTFYEVKLGAGVSPDFTDDEPTGDYIPQTAAKKLSDYDDNRQFDGIKELLPEIVTVLTQEICKNENDKWMITQQGELSARVLQRLKGLRFRPGSGEIIYSDDVTIDDTRGLGVVFSKFNLLPLVPKELVEASNRVAIERRQRESQLVQTETNNAKIAARLDLYREGKIGRKKRKIQPPPNQNVPDFQEIRKEIVQEQLIEDEKYSVIENRGGINVAKAQTGQAAAGGTT